MADTLDSVSAGNIYTYALVGLLALFLIGVVLFVVQKKAPQMLGFQGKTLWHWSELLLVPAFITTATLAINAVQTQSNTVAIKENAFQLYIDRISDLVLAREGLGSSAIAPVARAHTSAVFKTLAGERAGRVLVFLSQLGHLSDFLPPIEGQDFSDATLKELNFDGLDLEQVNFTAADLESTSFAGADLEGTNFTAADLKFVVLRDASIENTEFGGANLFGADLRHVDLSGARNITAAQIALACTDDTTKLPIALGPGISAPENCLQDDD